ncbi:MAG: nitroreductase family protein [Candidatus Izemoplasmatales bacterium]|jgi:hypothetical protein|nr:nitroreductase family protein [Candidatus Izemoplasmatales bacterium]
MTIKEAIYVRQSCRNFNENQIETEKSEILNTAIEKINKESGLRVQLIQNDKLAFSKFLKSYGLFKGVSNFIALVGKRNDKNLDELVGYYGQKLVLLATTLELGTCFVGGTYDKSYTLKYCKEDEIIVLVIAIGNRAEKETNFQNMIRQISYRKNKPYTSFIESNSFIEDWIVSGVKAVSMGPTAVNRQGISLAYKDSELTIHINKKGSLDHVDLGIAKANFEIEVEKGAFELGDGARFNNFIK